jgi:NTP pyrophosphatase (non-canonical NTP hydrolase)
MEKLTLDAISFESGKAEDTHGPLPENIDRQFMILMEEVGELAQAMIEASHGRDTWGRVENESLQVASVAARIYEAVEVRAKKKKAPTKLASKPPEVKDYNKEDLLNPIQDRDRYGKIMLGRSFGPGPTPKGLPGADNWMRDHHGCGGIMFDYKTQVRTCKCGEVYNF